MKRGCGIVGVGRRRPYNPDLCHTAPRLRPSFTLVELERQLYSEMQTLCTATCMILARLLPGLVHNSCTDTEARSQLHMTGRYTGIQPFSQKSHTPTVPKEFQIGLYDPAEADLEHFWNCCSVGILGERLYTCERTVPYSFDMAINYISFTAGTQYFCRNGSRTRATGRPPPRHGLSFCLVTRGRSATWTPSLSCVRLSLLHL